MATKISKSVLPVKVVYGQYRYLVLLTQICATLFTKPHLMDGFSRCLVSASVTECVLSRFIHLNSAVDDKDIHKITSNSHHDRFT